MRTPSPPRPQGRPALPPEEKTRPYSVRLTEVRIEKLKRLKSEWLNKAIDRAKEPRIAGPSDMTKEKKHGPRTEA